MMTVEKPPSLEVKATQIYFLLFKTYGNELLGWYVQSSLTEEEIVQAIEFAARDWLLSQDGKRYLQEEELEEWGLDYANALLNIPLEILAQHDLLLCTLVSKIIELNAGENLLPEELRR